MEREKCLSRHLFYAYENFPFTFTPLLRDGGDLFRGSLDSREAQIIRRVYIDGCPWEQVAKELKVVRRTAYKIRDHALVNLAWMYEYIDDITGTVPAVQ